MADGHGGYRRPEHPAPVSGPGALSQRTDGGPTSQPPMVADGGPYGSRQQMEAIQGSAPMQGGGGLQPAGPPPVPLDAPSMRPGEPVTAGAASGAGPGPEAVGIQDDNTATMQQLAPLMTSLVAMANLPQSNPQYRAFVRKLRAGLSNLNQ